MRILIKYATRQRPEMFLDALRNIRSTIGDVQYYVLVSTDYTDGSMDDKMYDEARRIIPNIALYRGNNQSKVEAINADMDKAPEWDLLINMSDDMMFCEKNWGIEMINLIRHKWKAGTDFFAHFNDGFVHHRLPTMSIIGREAYERDGYIYHPSYRSFSCDAEAMFVAMMRGHYHYFDRTFFRHVHPANTGHQPDQLYRNNGKYSEIDTANYFERRRNLFFVKDPACCPFDPDDNGQGDVLEPPYEHPNSAAIKVRWRSDSVGVEG